ncbi:MAG TPA: PIN domain-containing protein [Acidobacteriaceae bacterium]|nr:PIN domain-containing protein [Acidobacteriaceae bacterium]
MLYMLDTNAVSYLIRRRSVHLQERMDAIAPGDRLCISAITEAELRYGVAALKGARKLAQAVELILRNIQVLPWTSDAAKAYAAFRAHNRALGLGAGDIDLLISAHAISEDATLVTSDSAIRKLKGGLITVNWADDVRPN